MWRGRLGWVGRHSRQRHNIRRLRGGRIYVTFTLPTFGWRITWGVHSARWDTGFYMMKYLLWMGDTFLKDLNLKNLKILYWPSTVCQTKVFHSCFRLMLLKFMYYAWRPWLGIIWRWLISNLSLIPGHFGMPCLLLGQACRKGKKKRENEEQKSQICLGLAVMGQVDASCGRIFFFSLFLNLQIDVKNRLFSFVWLRHFKSWIKTVYVVIKDLHSYKIC